MVRVTESPVVFALFPFSSLMFSSGSAVLPVGGVAAPVLPFEAFW